MNIFVVLCFLILWQLPAHSKEISTFVFEGTLQPEYNLNPVIERFVDSSGSMSFADILHHNDINRRWGKSTRASADIEPHMALWSRIRIVNRYEEPVLYYLHPGQADTVLIFWLAKDSSIHKSQNGYYPKQTVKNYFHRTQIPILLESGEERTYYFRSTSDGYFPASLVTNFILRSDSRIRNTQLFSSFTDGIMMLLILLSLMLFIIFKDRQYLIFILPLAAYLFWYSDIHGELHLLLNSTPPVVKFFNTYFTSWFYPLTVGIFFLYYVQVKKKLRWAYYLFWGLIAIMFVFAIYGVAIHNLLRTLNNGTVFALTLTALFIVVYLSIQGDKRARIWLVFTLPAVVMGMAYLVNTFSPVFEGYEVTSLFQGGALFSSLIIGYMMYERVDSTIRENIKTIREKERLVREQNVLLEKKVVERTRQLEDEKQKSESILLNILPSEVAEELKQTGGSEAKLFENVTVLFTDFVGFTNAAEQMTAHELVAELHNCFKAFDEIIQEFGLEKIKTVGDAYIAVAGLPVPLKDHACRVVNAAIEIRNFMEERQQLVQEKTFSVRIGIHSGPVVAGIVGVKKFAYDIWGDTVNITARMEQCSEAGKINISETTYNLIRESFNCKYRGEITAKNKGPMKMYFVNQVKVNQTVEV